MENNQIMYYTKKNMEERIVVESEKGFLIKVLKSEVDHELSRSFTSLKVQYLPRNSGRGRGNGRRGYRRNLAPRFQQAAVQPGCTQYLEAYDYCLSDYDHLKLIEQMSNMCIKAHSEFYDAHGGFDETMRTEKVTRTTTNVVYKAGPVTLVDTVNTAIVQVKGESDLWTEHAQMIYDALAPPVDQTKTWANGFHLKWNHQ